MTRKKLVSVNFYDIFPLTNGGQLSVLGICQGLANYFDVTLVMICGADVYKDKLPVSENLSIIPIERPRDLVREEAKFAQSMGLPHTSPITADSIWPKDKSMVKKLREVLKNADIVLIDHPYTYTYAKAAAEDLSLSFWHRANNVEADYMQSYYKQYSHCDELVDMVKDIERRCCQGSDRIFTVTELDKQKLCNIYGLSNGKVTNISVGSNVENIKFIPPSKREKNKILYLSGIYPAASEAMERIVKAAEKLPQYDFIIAGMICSAPALRGKLPDNLYLKWVVSNNEKEELLSTCSLALNPVLSGSGINMKLIDDFAYGIPVLTTAYGARGIDIKDKVEAMIEDGKNIVAVINDFFTLDISCRDELARNARLMVEKKWTWRAVAEKMLIAEGMELPELIVQHNYPLLEERAVSLSGKTVFLWGAGEQGVFCLHELKKRNPKTIRVVDSNPLKCGSIWNEIMVEHPQALYDTVDTLCVISVGALTDAVEIYRECLSHGVDENRLIIARGPLLNPVYLDYEKLRG